MISERTLKKWRRDALQENKPEGDHFDPARKIFIIEELNKRIIKMTQELLDQWLLGKPI